MVKVFHYCNKILNWTKNFELKKIAKKGRFLLNSLIKVILAMRVYLDCELVLPNKYITVMLFSVVRASFF